MWGELVLDEAGRDKYPLIPAVIELACYRPCHYLGRVPNPTENSRCVEPVQHCIPVGFLSATHCSLACVKKANGSSSSSNRRKESKFVFTDFSSNGSYVKRLEGAEEEFIHNRETSLTSGDQVIFKFKQSPPISYTFQEVEVADSRLETRGPTQSDSVPPNQLMQFHEEVSKLESRLIESQRHVDDLTELVELLRGEKESLTQLTHEKSNEIARLEENIRELSANNAAQEAFSRNIKSQLQESKSQLATLTTRADRLAADLSHKSEQVSSRDALLMESNRILSEEKRLRKSLETQLSDVQSQFEETQKQLERVTTSNGILQEEIGDLMPEMEELKRSNDHLNGQRLRFQNDQRASVKELQSLQVLLQKGAVALSQITETVRKADWTMISSTSRSPMGLTSAGEKSSLERRAADNSTLREKKTKGAHGEKLDAFVGFGGVGCTQVCFEPYGEDNEENLVADASTENPAGRIDEEPAAMHAEHAAAAATEMEEGTNKDIDGGDVINNDSDDEEKGEDELNELKRLTRQGVKLNSAKRTLAASQGTPRKRTRAANSNSEDEEATAGDNRRRTRNGGRLVVSQNDVVHQKQKTPKKSSLLPQLEEQRIPSRNSLASLGESPKRGKESGRRPNEVLQQTQFDDSLSFGLSRKQQIVLTSEKGRLQPDVSCNTNDDTEDEDNTRIPMKVGAAAAPTTTVNLAYADEPDAQPLTRMTSINSNSGLFDNLS